MTSPMPERLIVADASPLIGLAKIGRLDLLRKLAEEVWIPHAVWCELIEGGRGRPEAEELAYFLSGAVREIDPGPERTAVTGKNDLDALTLVRSN
jgi:hypothetical protein